MQLAPFLSILSEDLQKKYLITMIEKGNIDQDLWNCLVSTIEDEYRCISNLDQVLINTLALLNPQQRSEVIEWLKKYNHELFEKLSVCIYELEDINLLPEISVKKILSQFSEKDIVKASMIVSPKTVNILCKMFPDIDFIEIRKELGSIPLKEIKEIHQKMVEQLQYLSSENII